MGSFWCQRKKLDKETFLLCDHVDIHVDIDVRCTLHNWQRGTADSLQIVLTADYCVQYVQ